MLETITLTTILWVIAAIFVAALVRSTFGFADALIGMPLLLMILPLRDATALTSLYGLLFGLLLSARNFANIRVNQKETLLLLLGGLLGIPLGIALLFVPYTNVALLIFAVYLLVIPFRSKIVNSNLHIKNNRYAMIPGFIGGIFGGAFNTNGPPVATYGELRQWSPKNFIAILQPYFVIGNVINIIGYTSVGIMNTTQLKMLLWSLPAVAIAFYFGHLLNKIIDPRLFTKIINAIIFISGLLILYRIFM